MKQLKKVVTKGFSISPYYYASWDFLKYQPAISKVKPYICAFDLR